MQTSSNLDIPNGSKCVLLFYVYVLPLWDEEKTCDMLSWQQEMGIDLKLSGRIRVANEGLNVNISGLKEDIDAYCEELLNWDNNSIKSIDFKLAKTSPKDEFRGLKAWRVKEICGLGVEFPPNLPGGRHVSPQDFHGLIERAISQNSTNRDINSAAISASSKSLVLLDARNLYETRIGRFEPPNTNPSEGGGVHFIAPPTLTFSDLPLMLDNLHEEVGDLTGRTVLMYCTGGVRCERASQYLKMKHPEVRDSHKFLTNTQFLPPAFL
jgi:predicted sulfurtransferase